VGDSFVEEQKAREPRLLSVNLQGVVSSLETTVALERNTEARETCLLSVNLQGVVSSL
jgi:hypothetical protein